jgi:hypothetical protein
MIIDTKKITQTGTIEIKKNYGKTKTSIQRIRDKYKGAVDKKFAKYKFDKKRLLALEWRRDYIYKNINNIIKILEYYKAQYNRFYKFYINTYDAAIEIAKNQTLKKDKDPMYDRYKKYADLYYKWFDIIIPQSINSAKAEGRSHYYLPTAMSMNKLEGNNMAEKVYWTPYDSLQQSLKQLFIVGQVE